MLPHKDGYRRQMEEDPGIYSGPASSQFFFVVGPPYVQIFQPNQTVDGSDSAISSVWPALDSSDQNFS